MKSILLSIRPKWIAKILNGDKTIEVRKRFPKEYKGWVYIYCTKEDSLIKLQERYKDRYICEQEFRCDDFPKMYSGYEVKGKVVARFYCDMVEDRLAGLREWVWEDEEILNKSCLTFDELVNYSPHLSFYAIHISQLEIFDKPKELEDFARWYPYYKRPYERLTKAPQSYMFIEVEK